MAVNLQGLIFNQVMPENSGGAEFDSDLDGATTQEDEFVSFTNTTGAPLDISGWQVWSVSAGTGAPDAPTSGLYHTFPAGTVVAPGDTLYVINEITGTPRTYAQEASAGGVQSGAGGTSTNLLTEGSAGNTAESIALRNPVTGQYIVFNMSSTVPTYMNTSPPGFPVAGSTRIGVIDGNAVKDDPAAGFSYQYDAVTDKYIYGPAFLPCFASGTLIATPLGARLIEDLRTGDLVLTADMGPQPILLISGQRITFADQRRAHQLPIEFKPGSFGTNLPEQPLVVSPQHRMLMVTEDGSEVLVPALGLEGRPGVRRKRGVRAITYYHILLPSHGIVFANGVASETLYPGCIERAALPPYCRLAILAHFPTKAARSLQARNFLTVQQTRQASISALRPALVFANAGQECVTQ